MDAQAHGRNADIATTRGVFGASLGACGPSDHDRGRGCFPHGAPRRAEFLRAFKQGGGLQPNDAVRLGMGSKNSNAFEIDVERDRPSLNI